MVTEALIGTTDQVISVVNGQLPVGFPADVADAMFEGLRRQRDRLAGMPSSIVLAPTQSK